MEREGLCFAHVVSRSTHSLVTERTEQTVGTIILELIVKTRLGGCGLVVGCYDDGKRL
jgi:hypothetical protein